MKKNVLCIIIYLISLLTCCNNVIYAESDLDK